MGASRVKVFLKSAVWGFGVLRSVGCIVLVHAFFSRFQVSSDAVWFQIKSLFYRDCGFSRTTGLGVFWTQLAGFSLPYHFSFHALILL